MSRALLVSPSFLPGRGGIESYLADVCRAVAPDIAVLAPAERDGSALPQDLPYETIGHPGRLLWPGRRAARAVLATARGGGFDRIIFGTPWPIALIAPSLARAGVPYASFVHGAELLIPATMPKVGGLLLHALAHAEQLFPVSEFTASKLRSLLVRRDLPVPPIEVVPPGVDTTVFHPDAAQLFPRSHWGLSPEDKVILHLGRLVPRKGAHRLVAALPALLRRDPRCRIVIAGTGPQLRSLQRSRGDRTIVTGRVSHDEARALYAHADVFALPVVDRWFGREVEGLGVVLLEASAAGTPCVTGRSGGTPEAVLDGHTGYVVDAGNEDALTAAIIRVLTDDALQAHLGERARAYVQERFSGSARLQPLLDWMNHPGDAATSPS